jgi:hypothetical protein
MEKLCGIVLYKSAHVTAESIAMLPPIGHIEGHKWFFQISSQRESQKNRFALISLGKIHAFTSLSLRSPILPPQLISKRWEV